MGFKKTFIEEKNIRKKILDFLSRREHSYKELIIKLKDRVDSRDKLIDELDRVRKEGLQSDERFSESYIRARSIKGFGPNKISNELLYKGVDENLVFSLLENNEINWTQCLKKAYIKKSKSINISSTDDKEKLRSFLHKRGFDYDEIDKVINK